MVIQWCYQRRWHEVIWILTYERQRRRLNANDARAKRCIHPLTAGKINMPPGDYFYVTHLSVSVLVHGQRRSNRKDNPGEAVKFIPKSKSVSGLGND